MVFYLDKDMEDNNGTPFTCSTEDCNLRFPTQDHLSAHRKKHGMVLNLGTKSNMFADQTPTPTRFIRNCEEVGLFQDLQNVNPFEETFRKAVEAAKTGSAAFQAPSLSTNSVGDDTLHTPHVFPHIIGNETSTGHPEKSQMTGNSPGIGEEELDISSNRRQAVKVVRQEADTSQLRSTLPISKCNISVVVDSPTNDRVQTENVISTTPGAVQVILRMLADGRLVQLAAKTVDGEKQNEQARTSHTVLLEGVEKSGNNRVIFHTSPEEKVPVNKMSLAKQKLKALLGNHSPPVIDKEKIKHKESSNSKLSKTKKDSKFETQPSSRRSSTIANVENDDDVRRKKFLERNRAAAMRCRERRKSWVAELERRAEHMLTTNQQLQLEVASLKAEVAQLKTLLLAHKDCPVTQAMSQGNIPTHMFDMAIPVSVEPSVSTSGSTSSVIYLSSPHFKKKQTSVEDITFRQNLRKKLCTVSTNKSTDPLEKDENISKKNVSLDIQSNRLPSLIKSHAENSQLIKCDEYLNSALITNSSEPFTVQDFNTFVTQKVQHNEKPVATQVIQFNPNVLHRENSLRLPSVENDDEESILQISPPSNAYS